MTYIICIIFVSGGAALEGAWHTAGGQSLLDRRMIRTEDKEYYRVIGTRPVSSYLFTLCHRLLICKMGRGRKRISKM